MSPVVPWKPVSLAMLLASTAVAWHLTHWLDRSSTRTALPDVQTASPAPAHLALAPVAVRSGDRLRLQACAEQPTSFEARLRILDGQGHELAAIPFEAEEARGGRCHAASWDGTGAPVRAEIVPVAATTAWGARFTLTRTLGPPIRPWMLLPALFALLALVVAAEGAVHSTRPPTDPAERIWEDRRALRSVAGPLVALLGWALSFAVTLSAAVLFARAFPGTLASGRFALATTIVQHLSLAFVSAVLLGALDPGAWAGRLGFVAPPRSQIGAACAWAVLLVAVAVGTTHWIKDMTVSPMGRALENVSMRYVIGFGALLAPLSEEWFFRGAVYASFERFGPVVAVVASALTFVGVHVAQHQGSWLALIPIASVGIVNGVLRARTGGISQPWLVHVLYNFTLSLSVYAGIDP